MVVPIAIERMRIIPSSTVKGRLILLQPRLTVVPGQTLDDIPAFPKYNTYNFRSRNLPQVANRPFHYTSQLNRRMAATRARAGKLFRYRCWISSDRLSETFAVMIDLTNRPGHGNITEVSLQPFQERISKRRLSNCSHHVTTPKSHL